MQFNILIEGSAGQGPNALAKVIGNILTKAGYFVFISREYGSFIRGGHNANSLSISDKPIMSNSSKPNLKIKLETDGENNMFYAGKVVKYFGFDFNALEAELKKLKNFDENLKQAKRGYKEEKTKTKLKPLRNKIDFSDGSEAIAIGAIKSGLDTYFAYPMTPSTGVMGELAERQI